MVKQILSAVVVVCLSAHPAFAQDAKAVIASASKAIGADGINSLTFHGSGATYGQSSQQVGPRTNLSDYRRSIDFRQPASRATASQGAFNQVVTPAESAWANQLEIWTTPWGFLRGAAANSASIETRRIGGERVHVISWSAPFKSPSGQAYRVVGYISGQTFHVDAVETWVDAPGAAQQQVKLFYGNWQSGAGAFKYPATIVQHRAGRPTFEVQIAGAEANPANIQELIASPGAPANVRGDGRGAPAPGGAPAGGQARPSGTPAQ